MDDKNYKQWKVNFHFKELKKLKKNYIIITVCSIISTIILISFIAYAINYTNSGNDNLDAGFMLFLMFFSVAVTLLGGTSLVFSCLSIGITNKIDDHPDYKKLLILAILTLFFYFFVTPFSISAVLSSIKKTEKANIGLIDKGSKTANYGPTNSVNNSSNEELTRHKPTDSSLF